MCDIMHVFTGHLSHANFSVVKNLWNFPATPMSEDSKIFQVLPPENFNLFSVPFQTDGTANVSGITERER